MSVARPATAEWTFPAEPEAVRGARRAVREAVAEAGGPDGLLEAAELVTSELVTNSLVHAGTHVSLRVTAESAAVRVEVVDGSTHAPTRREWAQTAGTGRGLLIVDAYADRWGAGATPAGKVVWFEIGRPSTPLVLDGRPSCQVETVDVTLLDVPLLMQWAWQEHAATLLREYLLYVIEDDDRAIGQHAAASDALSVLHEQLPRPHLPDELDEVMESLVEPDVTARAVHLRLPSASVEHFEVLHDLLDRAVRAARQGELLGAPTQPEVVEMRQWICGEVSRQARDLEPTAWGERPKTPVDPQEGEGWIEVRDVFAQAETMMIATSDSSVIVAVTAKLVELLGYDGPEDLVGERVLVVIPERYHQAHIAGTTLHVTHGRDVLIGHWVLVPLVRADGSEVEVEMRVELGRYPEDRGFYIAHFRV